MKDQYALFRKGFEATLSKENKNLKFNQDADGNYVDEKVRAEWDKYVKQFRSTSVGSGENRQQKQNKPRFEKPQQAHQARPQRPSPKKQLVEPVARLNVLNVDFEIFIKENDPETDLTKEGEKNLYVSKETALKWAAYRRAHQQYANYLKNLQPSDKGPWIVGKKPATKAQMEAMSPEQQRKEIAFARKPYIHKSLDMAMAEAQKFADEKDRPFMVWSLVKEVQPKPVVQEPVKDAAEEKVAASDVSTQVQVITWLREAAVETNVVSKRISLLALNLLSKLLAKEGDAKVKKICYDLTALETANNTIMLSSLTPRNDIPNEYFLIHAAEREIESATIMDTVPVVEVATEDAAEDTKFSLPA